MSEQMSFLILSPELLRPAYPVADRAGTGETPRLPPAWAGPDPAGAERKNMAPLCS